MATLTPVSAKRVVNKFDLVAADTDGDEFANTGKEVVVIKNADTSPTTVTFETPLTIDAEAVTDKAVIIPASEQHLLGPFPTGIYNDANGKLQITYSSVTTLTIGIAKLP